MKPLILILSLILCIAAFSLWMSRTKSQVEDRLESICIDEGFDGLVSDRGRDYLCFRERVDGGYETVPVKVVMYYREREGSQ